MKKQLLITAFTVLCAGYFNNAIAQAGWNSSSSSGPGYLSTNSNTLGINITPGVNIGTIPSPLSTEACLFKVGGDIGLSGSLYGNTGLRVESDQWGACDMILNGITSTNKGQISFTSAVNNTTNDNAFTFTTTDATTNHWALFIKHSGKVVIGDAIQSNYPGNYNLYVQNGILTEKLKIALHTDATNWSDYVFNKDYQLMPLGEVASYVKTNKHLPGVPSAEEVGKDGIDVASMDATLLKKVEELTLYVIQQQKSINNLQKQNAELNQEVESLKK
ncbi:MAG TPA: hypothetical protein VN721_07990 [Flavipsychrobacter sp.]|nr:hypothetical protein [Flavipsychrobacter sp.]